MIRVVATIELKPGFREAYLSELLKIVPDVKAEQGCISYEPMVDFDSGLAVQTPLREDVVTVIEAWQDLDSLMVHFKTSHMLRYREAVKDFVKGLSLEVLTPAS